MDSRKWYVMSSIASGTSEVPKHLGMKDCTRTTGAEMLSALG